MIHAGLKRVSIREINFEDESYLTSFPKRGELLYESVKELGVIEPPLVCEGDGLTIVCGEGRLLAAKALDFKEVIVGIVKAPPLRLLEVAVESNLFRGLNLVEKSNALTRFLKYLPEREVLKRVLPKLGLPPTLKWFNLLKDLSSATLKLKNFVVKGKVNLGVLDSLTRAPASTQELFVDLFERFNFTTSEQKEVYYGILDLCKRQDLDERRVIESYFKEVTDRNEFLSILRKLLRPHLHSAESDFKRRRELFKSYGLFLELPFGFERDIFELRIRFKNFEELKEKAGLIQELLTKMKNS